MYREINFQGLREIHETHKQLYANNLVPYGTHLKIRVEKFTEDSQVFQSPLGGHHCLDFQYHPTSHVMVQSMYTYTDISSCRDMIMVCIKLN